MIAIEALTNAAIGLLVSWAATFFVLGYSVGGSAAVTVMFFCLSFIRGYFVRLVFSRLTVPGDYATRGHGKPLQQA